MLIVLSEHAKKTGVATPVFFFSVLWEGDSKPQADYRLRFSSNHLQR